MDMEGIERCLALLFFSNHLYMNPLPKPILFGTKLHFSLPMMTNDRQNIAVFTKKSLSLQQNI